MTLRLNPPSGNRSKVDSAQELGHNQLHYTLRTKVDFNHYFR